MSSGDNNSPRDSLGPKSPRQQTPTKMSTFSLGPPAKMSAFSLDSGDSGGGYSVFGGQQQPPPPQQQQQQQSTPPMSAMSDIFDSTSAKDQKGKGGGLSDIIRDRMENGSGLLFGLESNSPHSRVNTRSQLQKMGATGYLTVDKMNSQTKDKYGAAFPFAEEYPDPSKLPHHDDEQKNKDLRRHVVFQKQVDDQFPPDERISKLGDIAGGMGAAASKAEEVLIKRNNRAAIASGQSIFFELDKLEQPLNDKTKPKYTESELRFVARNERVLDNVNFYYQGKRADANTVDTVLQHYRGRSPSEVDDPKYFPKKK